MRVAKDKINGKEKKARVNQFPTAKEIMRESGYITVKEAAYLCGFTVNKIYHLMHTDKLDYCECGGRRFVTRVSLAKTIKAPPIQKRILEETLDSID